MRTTVLGTSRQASHPSFFFMAVILAFPLIYCLGWLKRQGLTRQRDMQRSGQSGCLKLIELPMRIGKQASAKGKVLYDKKARGVVLQPGDRVLVRNLSERGGPGKLRSYWEKSIYIVKEQFADNPVYVVYPESGDNRKTRTLHTAICCC